MKGLSILTSVEPDDVIAGPTNFIEWKRRPKSQSFGTPAKLESTVSGGGEFDRSSRYIESTNELFLCKPSENGEWDLWVVKNFRAE